MPPDTLPQQIIPETEAHKVPDLNKKAFSKIQIGLIIGIIVVVILLIAITVWFFTQPKSESNIIPMPVSTGETPTELGSITGLIDINGNIPANSTVTIRARDVKQATNSANILAIDLPAKDNTTWEIKNLPKGTSYEVYARLISNNTIIGSSEPQFISAPAIKESLRINIDPQFQTQQASASAVISGTIRTNGYIPPNSTIIIEGKKYGVPTFTTIANNLPALKSQVMSYATAISGQSYEVRGKLVNTNGSVIGTSNTIIVTAPAQNEILELNSIAQAPAGTPNPSAQGENSSNTISGYINLNGPVPQGATMVIVSRASGTSTYQVVQDSIQPKDDALWSWSGGQLGKSFDLKAVLKKPNGEGTFTDISTSNTITVTAPAENQQLSVNSSFQLAPPPGGRISIDCKTKNAATNQWNVVLNYNSIDQATAYWFQVGTTSGGSDYVNTAISATGGALQTTNVTLNDSVTYYARYAYSYNSNATTNTPNEFSPFSSGTSFKCPK